jgi:hypothetical protein
MRAHPGEAAVTQEQQAAIGALGAVDLTTNPRAARFIDDWAREVKLHPWVKLSPRQEAFLWRLVCRYWRSMPGALARAAAESLALLHSAEE